MKTREYYISILKNFKLQHVEKFGLRSIGIFGSVSRNEHTEDSDLDVFVDVSKQDYFLMDEMREELERLCGCRVDLVRLRPTLRPLLLKRIQEDGIYA
ncbi:nucleotidyltransferase [Palleniella muris]|uniref:Nucleotidyltransferase n=1 Tax=Palleniella muris TaxID=3038145 RepID=A0AC61QU70_9BACT|nr:nucleotidyltransferase domain-containing protein [Palleniella muris]TGX84175.1 nucleotidyltransferase [Palleniella muris]